VAFLLLLAACAKKPVPKTPEPPLAVSSPIELVERYSAGDGRTRWRLLDARTRERILAEIWEWQAKLEKDPQESTRVRGRLKLGSDPWKMHPEDLAVARLDAEKKPLRLIEAREPTLVVEEDGERREWEAVREEGTWRLRIPRTGGGR